MSATIGVMTGEKINLTDKEVAALHGIGLCQLRRMRAAGLGPRFIMMSGKSAAVLVVRSLRNRMHLGGLSKLAPTSFRQPKPEVMAE